MDTTRFMDGGKASTTEDSNIESKFINDVDENCCSNLELELLLGQEGIDKVNMDSLGQLFENCIQQVSNLEMQRDKLILELSDLQEPLMQIVKHLIGKLAETQRLLTIAQVDHTAISEEVQQVKRKLFSAIRDCIQSQVALAEQEYQVAQSAVTREELHAQIESLTEELFQLQQTHQSQLQSLREQASKPYRLRAMSDISQCRQSSLILQSRLSGSMNALEGLYEPRLMALLRRRQTVENTLRMHREQAADQKAKLEPLIEEIRRLQLRRSCLEHRITMMEGKREKRITQHKETVEKLQETLRDLQVEFEVQKQSKRNLEDLAEDLSGELRLLGACSEPSQDTAL